MTAAVQSARRYYLLKRRAAEAAGNRGLALLWKSKQVAEPGEYLSSSFPHATRLVALGYATREDLNGADECELYEVGFSVQEARSVLAAFAAL